MHPTMIVLSVRLQQMGAATAWLGRLLEDANEQRLHELMVDYGAVDKPPSLVPRDS